MSTPKKVVWSTQQQAFIIWCETGKGSCVLEAVAGSGKTTAILGAVQKLKGACAILAFNKKIAVEIEQKLKKAGIDWKKAKAGTVHSFGFSALRKSFPNVEVKDDKVSLIAATICSEDEVLFPFPSVVTNLVGLAKQRAIGVLWPISDRSLWRDIIDHFDLIDTDFGQREPPIEEIISAAQRVLKISNNDTTKIDFNDMVYLPLVHHCRFWQYDTVFIDEAQDTNPARRAIVRSLVRPGGRVIAVGDRHQAIYGFTGADSDSLDLIMQDFNAIRMPLTVTFRCPKAVVAHARQWVGHIEAAPTAPEGKVSYIDNADFFKRNDLNDTAAVLCRNTKPLVQTALQLIRQRVPCNIEGSDIAAGLIKLSTRWKVRHIHQLEQKLDDYLEKETAKHLARKQEQKAQAITDIVETIKVIIDQCRREKKEFVSDVVAWIESLFADDVTNVLILSTIHKSKGREWDRVFWLDRAGTLPSKYARQAWQLEQEKNLCYVAATRAMSELIEVRA